MSKKISKKINDAIARGYLVSYEDVLKGYTKKQQANIVLRARYLIIAEQLRKLREALQLSQDDFARRMHVKREYISRIESGRQNITLETLYRIGEVAGKKVSVQFK